jgi:hypothetical protein
MEGKKLMVEVELSPEEMEAFDRFIERGCYDREKIVRRWILEMIQKNAGGPPCPEGDYRHGAQKHHPWDPALFA